MEGGKGVGVVVAGNNELRDEKSFFFFICNGKNPEKFFFRGLYLNFSLGKTFTIFFPPFSLYYPLGLNSSTSSSSSIQKLIVQKPWPESHQLVPDLFFHLPPPRPSLPPFHPFPQ